MSSFAPSTFRIDVNAKKSHEHLYLLAVIRLYVPTFGQRQRHDSDSNGTSRTGAHIMVVWATVKHGRHTSDSSHISADTDFIDSLRMTTFKALTYNK